MSDGPIQHRQRKAAFKSLAAKCLMALAIVFGIVAALAGGCAAMEINTGAREAFAFWGAVKLLAISAGIAALCYRGFQKISD